MKKAFMLFVYFILFIASATSSLYADGWRKAVTYTMEPIYGTYFISETTGWCTGGNSGPAVAVIYKTTDGGSSWKEVYRDNSSKQLYKIQFINSSVGFAGGAGAKLLKSTDGGSSWTAITIAGLANDITSIYFSDEQTGWILTNSGVMKTADGGSTWTSVLSLTAATMYDMCFWGNNHGVISGKTIGDFYYTKDGNTWTKSDTAALAMPYSKTDVRTLFGVNDSNVYAGGWGSFAVSNPTLLLKSTDGGATWNHMVQNLSARTYDYVYSMYFKDKDNGIAAGGSSRGSLLLRTSDGGKTWTQQDVPAGESIKAIYGIGNSVWISNTNGFCASSKDFGNSWEIQNHIPMGNLYSVQFTSEKIAFGSGFGGTLLKSTDYGKSWNGKYLRVNNCSPTIQDMYFINDNTGYTAHSYRLVSKTTDGGNTWTAVIPDTADANSVSYGVFFLNESFGFVVGKHTTKIDFIYKTTDGGKTWTKKSPVFKVPLRDVAFTDENNGIIVGDGLKAGYTIDGGSTWTPSSFNGVPAAQASAQLRKVTFIAPGTAIAVGDAIVLKTTDGGANWNYIPVAGLAHSLTGLVFKDASKGWTTGTVLSINKKSGIFETTDGGDTWTDIADTNIINSTATIYDVTLDGGNMLWIGADNGNIYTNSPTSGVDDERRIALKSFELAQNYPNPFNPNTTIEYSLPEMSNVVLNIYDALGRCIKTLVNQKQNAGVHRINFNASGLSSGIYLYSLNVDGKLITRKMSIVK